MKKFYIALAFAVFIAYPVFSQKPESEFGIVSQDELKLSTYEKDAQAEAVVLFDRGESVFFDTDRGYDIRFTRTKRIKILDRTGIKYSEISIPFYAEGYDKTEKITSIEAYTYNYEDGRVVKKALDQATVFEETVNDRWKVKKFVFPSVQAGSVIEYKYVLETPFHFNLPDWSFQDRIPTKYSEYTVSIVPFYEYVFLAQGIKKFHYQNSTLAEKKRTFGAVSKVYGQNVGNGFEFQDMIHTYVMKDIPAFRDESYITSADDFIMKIDFQLAKFHHPRGGTTEIISSWPKLTENLLKHEKFGKYIKSSRKYAKKILASEIELNGKSDIEKSNLIIDYVRSGFSWNGSYSKYASRSPKEFVKQKTGNAADINLFLIALLDAAGLDAQAVILSTRDHGKIKADYPFDHFFNYIVVLVNTNERAFLADGTEDLIAFDRIPPRCINEKGLIVTKKGISWVGLDNATPSLDSKTINLKVDPEKLSAEAFVSIQSTEFESFNYKNSFRDDTVKLKDLLLDNGFSKIGSIRTINYERNTRPYVISFQGETAVERLGDKIIISPFLNFPLEENQLSQEKRSYPVDFIYSKTKMFESLINIPDGFDVLSLPENYKIDNELAEINLKYTKANMSVEASASYTFKKAVYKPDEYAKIRGYLDTIIKKFNEQIVLDKI